MIEQDKNAFAYVIYEESQAEPGKWIRSVMFYADDPAHSDRDATWEYNVGWRNPKNIRVVPLFDEDGNDARRDANLDEINARYEAEVERTTMQAAVESALETELPVERFEGMLRTLRAFDTMVSDQLQLPPNTVTRADYLPSAEEIEVISSLTKE